MLTSSAAIPSVVPLSPPSAPAAMPLLLPVLLVEPPDAPAAAASAGKVPESEGLREWAALALADGAPLDETVRNY